MSRSARLLLFKAPLRARISIFFLSFLFVSKAIDLDLRWQEKLAELKHIQQLKGTHHIVEAIIYRSLCDRGRQQQKLDLKFHLSKCRMYL